MEFSWEGQDEMDSVSGRGWAVLNEEQLQGRLFFHRGDESGFRADRATRSNHTVETDARKGRAPRLS